MEVFPFHQYIFSELVLTPALLGQHWVRHANILPTHIFVFNKSHLHVLIIYKNMHQKKSVSPTFLDSSKMQVFYRISNTENCYNPRTAVCFRRTLNSIKFGIPYASLCLPPSAFSFWAAENSMLNRKMSGGKITSDFSLQSDVGLKAHLKESSF